MKLTKEEKDFLADMDELTCCVRCGFVPLEGMEEYLLIHGSTSRCIVCHLSLRKQSEWHQKLKGHQLK